MRRTAPRVLAGLSLALAMAVTPVRAEPVDGGRSSMLFSAGVFALVEQYDYPYSVGAAFYAKPATAWRLVPGAGLAVGPDGIAFLYGELRRDFALGGRWFCTPSLGVGLFTNGDEIGPRDHLEFQPGIAFSREFTNGLRFGLAGLHVSNGGLSHPNNGTEALALTLQLPL